MSSSSQPQYVALLGCTGSGKSLTSSFLRRMPRVRLVSEGIFPDCVAHIVNQPLAPEVRFALSAGFAHKVHTVITSGPANSRAAVLASVLSGEKNVAELVSTFRRGEAIESYLFESNFFTLAPEFVFESLPSCRIVHLVRDGRDCAEKLNRRYNTFSDENLTSLANAAMFIGRKYDHRYVPWWVDDGWDRDFMDATPFVRCMWFWKAMAVRFQRFLDNLDEQNRQRVIIVRYEDLVVEPSATLERVLRFINRRDAVPALRGLRRIHTNEVGRSRVRDRYELQTATDLAAEQLAYYGYPTEEQVTSSNGAP